MTSQSIPEAAAPAKKPNIVKRLYNWVLSWAETPYGTPALFVISFAESSFFPIPPDVLQIALSVAKPKRSYFYTRENFTKVEAKYNEHAFLAIFGAAFTPVPFKVFTIASGVFEVGLTTLVLASICGRGLRFMSVATAIFFFGPTVKYWLERYFELATILLTVVGVLGFVAIKYLI
jgi:membrane protein YqaA with SNARE-associated domain